MNRQPRGETVLCLHKSLLYEAKIIKYEICDKQIRYLIHYAGWNRKWDEWVLESEHRIHKVNRLSLQKQKELLEAFKLEKSRKRKSDKERDSEKGSRGRAPVVSPPQAAASGGQCSSKECKIPGTEADSSLSCSGTSTRPRHLLSKPETSKEEKTAPTPKTVEIAMPDELKRVLREDWNVVNRQKLMPSIPCEVTVEDVLERYRSIKITDDTDIPKRDGIILLTLGLQDHFNTFLLKRLLYHVEKPYFQQIVQQFPDKKLSEICGPIYLLRLFVRIGEGLSAGDLTEKCRDRLIPRLHDFLGFLAANPNLFDSTNYCTPQLDSAKCSK